ncbi:MAG: hypothetical protein JW940_12090 [Polyangiaceae bacterium]|nr:hypothetical protein [Polyangiaceae bacterium]
MDEYEPDSGLQVLMEINLHSEVRKIMDGEEPLPSEEAVGRIVWLGGESIPLEGLRPDSRTRMRMPSPNVNDERLSKVTVEVLVGDNAYVLISSDQPVPKSTLRLLARRSADELLEAVDLAASSGTSANSFDDIIDVAGGIRYAALSVLRGRISDIEQAVRDALSDEQVTEEDYAAIREYPAQLALVEEHARAVRDVAAESLRPKARASLLAYPISPSVDFYFKHADDVETEARRAVGTLSGLVSSQQVVIVQRQRLEVERLQRVISVVGAAILVPGLVAAIFGANVDVPGQNSESAFWGMLLLMVAGGLGSYWLLRSAELGLSTRLIHRMEISERTWLCGLGASAILLLMAGVVILVDT